MKATDLQKSMKFRFLKLPWALIKNDEYSGLSSDAKLLYSLLLDRTGLSLINADAFTDKNGDVFVCFTIEEAMCTLKCGHDKATQLFRELEKARLLARKRCGCGRPYRISVKKFNDECGISADSECEKAADYSAEKPQYEVRKISVTECGNSAGNNNNNNNTNINHTHPSIFQERFDEDFIKEMIGYDYLISERNCNNRNYVDAVLRAVYETVNTTADTVRIGGRDMPADAVRSAFLKLDYEKVDDLLEKFDLQTAEVKNAHGYLITSLYNAALYSEFGTDINFGHYFPESMTSREEKRKRYHKHTEVTPY